uniref:C3H1-type domain-containing protein n=1 Tax=Tetradesmus obliquus TaxID=3088 RepID=A0A383VUY1_TETOB|eukprot:jgi/Sobl393_1/17642/SZX69295.1
MNCDGVAAGGVTAEAITQHQAQVSALLQQHFGLSPEYNEANGLYDVDSYRMCLFKVLPCPRSGQHDWSCCPYAHHGERARRRCLLLSNYATKVCPDMMKGGECPRGEACTMTHSMFEYWMHPLRYKTKMCCKGASCLKRFCFFAHTPEEVRPGSNTPPGTSLLQPATGACCIPAPFTADGASSTQQGTFAGHAAMPALQLQQQQQLYMIQGPGGMHSIMPQSSSTGHSHAVAPGGQMGLHGIMPLSGMAAAAGSSSSSSASSSSWAAMPDAMGVQQAHGTLPLSAMMSPGQLAAAGGYLSQQQQQQQQQHILHSPVFMQQQQQLHGQHHSPGQMPAYSSPAAMPLVMQLQQMSLGGVQVSQAAGVPSTGAMNALLLPQLAPTALGMPPATAAMADHGARLLLDPHQQQQQQQIVMMPVASMQQYMAGSYGAPEQPGGSALPPM